MHVFEQLLFSYIYVSAVCTVVQEDLGSSPSELFDDFSRDPIASARYVTDFVPQNKS
jgi:hypothetical protein